MNIEWQLLFFTLFVCLGCGLFAGIVFLVEWRGAAKQIRMPGMILALVALGAGGIASALHLGHMERIFNALSSPGSSIFQEAALIGLLGLDILIYLFAMRRGVPDSTLKAIASVGLIPAVILAFAVGNTYVLGGRPSWNSLFLPLVYLASAGVMGCFALSALAPETSAAPNLWKLTVAALAVQAVLLVAYLVHVATAPYQTASRSVARLFTGDLAALFWVGLILLGFLLPGALLAWGRARKSLPVSLSALGLAGVLLGGVSFRALMFSIGSSVIRFGF
jgi:anaerobic dimethyl sulfoxide reductase subunit C (anchor subunit)